MTGKDIRRIVLEQSYRAGVGHIGCALSVSDIIATLYSGVLHIEGPTDPDRDRFILSKGHAALALYAALYLRCWITGAELNSYCVNGSKFGPHPEQGVPGVELATGSLGHGLSVACGMALAAKLTEKKHRVFCLLSDSEMNEGSTWEAILFAGHHELSNLTVIVDVNGQQALNRTEHVLNTSPLADKWYAFGWSVNVLPGHDPDNMRSDLKSSSLMKPNVLLALTVFGKGVSFMERQVKWHYMPMTKAEYEQAMKEVEST